jgi:hypothetical protein
VNWSAPANLPPNFFSACDEGRFSLRLSPKDGYHPAWCGVTLAKPRATGLPYLGGNILMAGRKSRKWRQWPGSERFSSLQ